MGCGFFFFVVKNKSVFPLLRVKKLFNWGHLPKIF